MTRDRSRLDGLYKNFGPRVAVFLRSRGIPPADVQDLVQESYVVAVRRSDQLPPDDEEARRWLFAVALRVQANYLRSQRRRQALVDRLQIQQMRFRHGIVEPPDERHKALEGWRSLAPEDQELLRLKGWQGLASQGVASRVNCSQRAAEMRLSRARARLRSVLS